MTNRFSKILFITLAVFVLICACTWAAAEGGVVLTLADYNEDFVQVSDNGSAVTVKLNQWVHFSAYAPGAGYISFHALAAEYDADTVLDDSNEFGGDFTDPNDEEGRVDQQWIETGFTNTATRYIVAQAHYFGVNDTETTAVSNIIALTAEYDGPISGSVTFTVPEDVNTVYSTSDTGTIRWKVPKDGRLFIDVNNMEGVDFFGAYIAGATTDDQWLADSHWVPLSDHNPEHTTRVPLTVPRCTTGNKTVRVFAIKYGSPQKNASKTIPIRVTKASSDCPVILSMGDKFVTGEPLRVFAHYTNPVDEEFPEGVKDGALMIRIHEKDNPGNEVFNEMQGFEDFWNDSDRIWQSGFYVIDAYIFQYGQQVRAYEGIKEIEVMADGCTTAPQVQPILAFEVDHSEEGQDLVLDLSVSATDETVMPEWFEYALFRADWGHSFITSGRGELNTADGTGTVIIHRNDLEAGGQYWIRLFSMKPGYNVGVTEFRFVTTSAGAQQNLVLKVDGSTEVEQNVLSSHNVNVKVEFESKPTMIRVVNGDNRDYWWGDDSYERDWGYGDDDIILYAEASWDDIDLDSVDWENFDWDRDLHWTGKSNVIVLHVESPNGEMRAPEFSISNPEMGEQGSGVIPWGDDLVINIADDGPTDMKGNIVEDGWFFCNIDIERYNENGGTWWERINYDYGYDIHSGENRIPTYNLEGDSRYQIEIGADGEGYSGRSQWIEFTLGERNESEEDPISYFTVEGQTENFEIPTCTNMQLLAYRTGANWYEIEITKEDDEGWNDRRDNNRSGMLIDNWRSDREGIYTLTAYGYVNMPEGEQDEYGNNQWKYEIGSVTVTVTAEGGDLGEMGVTMADKAYVGDQLEIMFDEVQNAEEYSYWIHRPDDGWIMGDSRRSPGSLTIDTRRLEPGVYWVELDAMATGYNQSHMTLHFALIENEATDYSDPNGGYYFSISSENILTETDAFMVAYIPGSEETELSYRKNDEDERWTLDRRNGPGLAVHFSRGDAGTYEIYLSGCQEDSWGEPMLVCTLTITAENTFANDPEVTVNGSGEGVTVFADEQDPQKMTIVVERDAAAEGYQIQLQPMGEWPIFGWFTDLNSDEEDDRITITDDEIIYVIEDERIQPGLMYEIQCWVHATGYECRGSERTFLLQRDGMTQNLTLTANGKSDEVMDVQSSTNLRVKVEYNTETRPTAIRIQNGDWREYWWGEEDNFERDWGYGEGVIYLYAEATWDDIDFDALQQNGWNDFDWDRDVNWTGKSNLIQVNVISPFGDMKTPDFAITNQEMGEGGSGVIPWGDDLIIYIEDNGPMDTAGKIVDGGWFYMNFQVERYNEDGGSWWENLNNNGYSIHSGINYIPTYNLDGNCRYQIEIGADARGYNGRSRWVEFRLGEIPEEQDIRSFKVNGSTEHEFNVLTNEEILLAVYRSGAEWYRVEIRKENDDGWYNQLNDNGSGMLLETWRPDQDGTYQLMAVACGHLRDENGEITEDEEGRDFWEDAIGRATIYVSSPNGDLGAPWVDVPMTVNAGEDIYITWHLDENVEEYSFWIGSENGENWYYSDSRNAGEILRETGEDQDTYDFVIPAGSLEGNRVYRVYLDTRAAGYGQGHDNRILYVLGAPEEDQEIISITGPDEIVFGQDFPIEVSAPGARDIQIWWQTANSFRGADGDYTVQWFCQDWDPADFQYDTENDSCHFFAIARYDDSRLKVTPHISIPFNRENVGYATAPSLTILNEGDIQRGEFIEALVEAIPDEGVTAYQVYLTDMDDNWIDFGYSETAGLFLLPTNNLETDTQYKVRAYARVPGTIRTDSEPEIITIRQATANRFIVSKTEVQVCEPLAVSILAPGAERIRFSSGYDSWWNDEGWEGDCWSDSEVRWEYSEDPDIIIRAEAWFPGDSEWTEIGTEHIRVTAVGSLEEPQIDVPATVPAGQDLYFTISEVENAEFYRINIWRNDDGAGWTFDAEPGENMIPGRVLYGGGYRIEAVVLARGYNARSTVQDLYVEPLRPDIQADSVVSNASDLDIRVPLMQDGKEYALAIHYVPADDLNDFEASYVYRNTLHDSDAVNGILTFTVPAGTLRDGMTHWVDCYVSGDDGFFCENAKAFLVHNGQADGNITISVDGDTSGAVNVLIHKDYRVNVSAPGANAIYIRCGDDGRYFFGDNVEAYFNEYQTYPETLYAQACYETLPEGDFEWESLNWSAPSNPVVITFYATGQVGQPGFDMPDSVAQGDILVISNIDAGNHANETHANINRGDPWHEAEWVYQYGWHGWDAATRTIYLSTSMLEPGEYWVAVDNSGIGYTGNRSWRMFTVTPHEEQPEHGIIISAPAKVQTGAALPVSIYAPGAMQVGFAFDLSDVEKQNPSNYKIMDGEIYYEMEMYRFDEKGNHTISACALFEDNGAWMLIDQAVDVCDPLRFNLANIPGVFTAGQTDASVTIPLPIDAQRMCIQVYADRDGHRETIYDSRGDLYEDTTIGIPADKLAIGTWIQVDFQARADGFEECCDGIAIPITAAQGNKATLSVRTGDINDVWLNEGIEFLVSPTTGNTLTAVRFYSGNNWWDVITPENNGEWFDQGSAFFWQWYYENSGRILTVFAEVQVAGSDAWTRTNTIQFKVKNNGTVGAYDFTDPSQITAARGSVIEVTFEPAAGADSYWADAFSTWDGCSWGPETRNDEGTTIVRINTINLVPGTYELWGRAGGPRLLWRQSDSCIILTITKDVPNMPTATFTTPSALTTIDEEAFEGTNAEVIEIGINTGNIYNRAFAGSNAKTVIVRNGNTWIDDSAFAGCGSITVYSEPNGEVQWWAERNGYSFYPIP